MNPERWQQVRELFDAAVALAPEERRAYLDDACDSDQDLREEVASLLRASEDSDGFLQSQVEASQVSDETHVLSEPWTGRQVGPYRIVERIGFGGMGVVYRAVDIRLGREAALKFLSADMHGNEHARDRFEREARAASTLNHPNICTIYGVDEFEGHPYLAMELLKGQTLGEVIAGKPLNIERLLDFAIAVVSALQAAHSEGIIHRDLKPANIFLTDKSQVKILDFGLAKQTALVSVVHAGGPAPQTSEETAELTTPGMIVGTISYMSPEQIRAERLDARSDLFAVGAVLYEMATGQLAFPGKLPVLVLDAILNRAPAPIAHSNPAVPARLQVIISRCLEKDRDQRYQNATALLSDLRHFQREWASGSGNVVEKATTPARLRWRAAVLASVLLISAAGGIYMWQRGALRLPTRNTTGTTQTIARPSIAVLGFENLTGRTEHAWLSTTFSEMLSTELAAGARMRVVSGEDAARARKDLDIAELRVFSAQTLARIRKNLGVDYVVTGTYLDAGGQLRLDARLQDARSGETIASVPETGSEAKLIDMLSRVGADLRAKLGIGDIEGSEITKVAATIPKDPNAARLYAEGLTQLRQLDPGGARDTLLNAVAIEPDHPLIHAALAEAWSQLGFDEKSRSEARQAASLAGQLPQSEQLWVEGRFRESNHELDKAIDVYRTLLGFYPDNLEYSLRLAAAQNAAGKQSDAMATIAAMRKLPLPASSDPRIDLAEASADEISADFKHESVVAAHAVQEANSRGARLLAARAQYAQAWAALNMGDMDQGLKYAKDSLAAYVVVGDRNGQSSMLRTLGTIRLMQGQLAPALDYYRDSLKLARQVGNRYSEAAAINQVATVLERQGKHSEALNQYQQVLAIMREIGNRFAESIALNNIANILWSQGDLESARNMYMQVDTVAQQLGDKSGEAGAAVNIAHTYLQEGNLKNADQQLQLAVPLARDIGQRAILAEAINSVGDVRLAQSNFVESRARYQEALSMREALGDELGQAESRESLGELSIAEGKSADAEKLLTAARDAFKKANSQDQEISAVGELAHALLDQGKFTEAHKTINSIRALAMRTEDPFVRSSFLIEAARSDAFSGSLAEARAALDGILSTARKHRFAILELRARLLAAEIELKKGDRLKGEAGSAAVRKDALGQGVPLIAHQAAALGPQ